MRPKILPLITLLVAVALAGCTTHIPVRSHIEIDAPVERVYATLIQFDGYPSWNPYHVRVAGRPELGAKLDVTVHRPDGKTVQVPTVHVLRLRENAELTWGGGIKGVFYGEHVFELRRLDENRTLLLHNEDFKGLFVGFADLPADVLTTGYEQMNQALKDHLEAG